MSTKFITNQDGKTLYDRFTTLIKNTQYFDVLVGYFYLSGFYKLRPSLDNTQKIRILIGLEVDNKVIQLNNIAQRQLNFTSSTEAMIEVAKLIKQDFENSDDNYTTYDSAKTFINWIQQGKIEIRLYKKQKIHSKIYIMSFTEPNHDKGRVITGSSNFTQSGLEGNIEYNIELRDDDDYIFAKTEFELLWTDSEPLEKTFVTTITTNTWISDSLTPYQLYLKFLYEHFRYEIDLNNTVDDAHKPDGHKNLSYQTQAVLSAKKILESYGGVFIADVVGLGKTIMGALLLQQYPKDKSLIIAPPHILHAWEEVNLNYRLSAKFISLGKIDQISELININDYANVIIDEAHRFRNENTNSYVKLAEICRGKRIILLSATPYNNNPKDLLSLVKLFQSGNNSNLPNLRNVEHFLNKCSTDISKLKAKLNKHEIEQDIYFYELRKIGTNIRERLLRYIMIRRTRDEIIKYFKEDLKNANFPKLNKPVELYYQLNTQESAIFTNTLQAIKNLKYARYKTISYLKNKPDQNKLMIANNLAGFMKTLLVKRLESSKAAFINTLNYFISSHESIISIYKNSGEVYVSKKLAINKIADLLEEIESGDDEVSKIDQLINDGKIEKHPKEDIEDIFIQDIKADLVLLCSISTQWETITRDIKLESFLHRLQDLVSKHKKIVIFTEASDTAHFLTKQLQSKYKPLCITGSSKDFIRQKVMTNFSTNTNTQKNDYNILITTDVLSEGVSLQRVDAIVNYDIPWNPTKMMQRIGRINRVDSKFDELFVYNFFPTDESNEEIRLTQNAKTKITMFIEILGTDSHTLTGEEDIGGKAIFDRLSNLDKDDDSDTESELEYLSEIKKIRDEQPDLFDTIKKLPVKCKTQRKLDFVSEPTVLSYFRQGALEKYITTNNHETKELDFIESAKLMRTTIKEPIAGIIDKTYFELLNSNKNFYNELTTQDTFTINTKSTRDPVNKLINILKACIKDTSVFIELDKQYYLQFNKNLVLGNIPPKIAKTIYTKITELIKIQNIASPFDVISIIKKNTPEFFTKEHLKNNNSFRQYKQEIILSEYFL